MSQFAIMPLEPSDSAAALNLSLTAGWNQTESDWLRVIALEPEGCYGVRCDGRLVSTSTTIRYGRDLAWIGMVLTDPLYRRRGFARALMVRCLEFLDQRNIERVRLDATDAGRGLYESFGFAAEYPVERWMRPPSPIHQPYPDPSPFHPETRLDLAAFGADRSGLLTALAPLESACFPGIGYAMGRPGSRGAYFGPCVSRFREASRGLLAWFLDRHRDENVIWDLIPGNHEALAIAQEFGFIKQRNLTRMAKQLAAVAPDYHEVSGQVYALAGFEFG